MTFPLQAGGTSDAKGAAISFLSDGSSIVTGYFGGTATFGNTTLTSAGGYDVFIAKLDANGNYVWVKQAGGTSGDSADGISSLSDGSSIVTGYFQGTATFGSTTLTSTGDNDVFIAKLDANGNYVWAKQAGGTSSDTARGISSLSDGSSIVTGDFRGSANFGSTTLTSAQDADVFITKLDANGNYVWVTQVEGGSGSDFARDISSLSDGSSIVTGSFGGTATFGSTTLTSTGANNVYPLDAFITKLDANGNFVWAKQAGGTSGDWSEGISSLSDGSSIVTGNFWGTATFGSTTLTSAGSEDVFIAKLDANGNYVWAKQAGGTRSDTARGISSLSDGSSIVIGNFNETASFGSTTLTSAGMDKFESIGDGFIAKLDANGNYVWAKQVVGTSGDDAFGVSSLSNGSSIVTGYFEGTATFGSTTLSSAGKDDADVFIAALDSNGNWISAIDTTRPTIAISSDVSSLKAGETATLTFMLSESSSDFVASDVTTTGGALSSFSGSGTTYTAIFTPTADSTTNGMIYVASSRFSDAAGNTNNDGSDSNNTVTLSVDTTISSLNLNDDNTFTVSTGSGDGLWIKLTVKASKTDFQNSLIIKDQAGKSLAAIGATHGNKNLGKHQFFVAEGSTISFHHFMNNKVVNSSPQLGIIKNDDGTFQLSLNDGSSPNDLVDDLIIDISTSTTSSNPAATALATEQDGIHDAILNFASIPEAGTNVKMTIDIDCAFDNTFAMVKLTQESDGTFSVAGVSNTAGDSFDLAVKDNLINPGGSITKAQGVTQKTLEWSISSTEAGYYAPVIINPDGELFTYGSNHVKGFGHNHFGFEDTLAGSNSDFDYNDVSILFETV